MSLLFVILLVTQPQGEVIWSRPDSGGVYHAVATQDINGDLHPDVLAAIYYTPNVPPPARLYCQSGLNGTTIWAQNDCLGVWGNQSLGTTRDVNGDSVRDVIMGTPGGIAPGCSVFLKSGLDGSTLWTWDMNTQGPNYGWVYGVSDFVDLNHDGYPEVLAAVGGNGDDRSGTVLCFNGHTGDTTWTYRVPADGAQTIAQVADINSDTVPEVAVGAGGNGLDNHVYLLDGRTGRQLWSYDMGNSVWTVARIRDVNNSGTDDVIAGSWNYNVACIEGSTGARIWDVPLGGTHVVMKVVPIRDVNRDSVDDVVVGSWSDSVYVLSGRDGSVIWSQPVGTDCWNVDTLSDVTGDGIPEVIAGALNGKVVKVFDGVTHQTLWQYSFNERIYDVSGAPDLDGDGQPDVLVSLQDQGNQTDHLFAFKGLPASAIEQRPARPCPWSVRARPQGLEISGPVGRSFRVSLVNSAGRCLVRRYEGRLTSSPMLLGLDQTLPSGCVFAVLTSPGAEVSVKVVTVR
jgi:outer membrane protein assembly factor BamB